MGGVASFFSPKPKPKSRSQVAREQVSSDIEARKAKKEEDERKSVAFKLAQIATGAAGVLSEAATGRRKLLGN